MTHNCTTLVPSNKTIILFSYFIRFIFFIIKFKIIFIPNWLNYIFLYYLNDSSLQKIFKQLLKILFGFLSWLKISSDSDQSEANIYKGSFLKQQHKLCYVLIFVYQTLSFFINPFSSQLRWTCYSIFVAHLHLSLFSVKFLQSLADVSLQQE